MTASSSTWSATRRVLRTALAASLVPVLPLTVTCATAAAAAAARPAPARAMWLWHRDPPADVIRWARHQGVREVFVHVPTDAAATGALPWLRELKTRADAAGIGLSALGGDPHWVHDHPAALAWHRTAIGTGVFSASHVDVEPYALDEWVTDRPATAAAFLALLDALRAQEPRRLEVDAPFWYDTVPFGDGTLADEVLARVDAVTVMSYRDTATGPNSMTAVAADMLQRGDAAGRPVRLGAETDRVADCPHCTFAEEGAAHLTAVLAVVDQEAASHPSFAGIAVHHYRTWRALPR